jgi:hypothetical protein
MWPKSGSIVEHDDRDLGDAVRLSRGGNWHDHLAASGGPDRHPLASDPPPSDPPPSHPPPSHPPPSDPRARANRPGRRV